jgi:Right handed beta helix region
MNKQSSLLKAIAFFAIIFACASAAHAQATRTWVSGVGDDANPCSRTAPCKTFAGSISKTADGGEIDCLDPGGFGVVTITKGITIDGNGTLGSILSAGTNGVIINDTTNTKTITLRNLSINGVGTGINGVRILTGRTVLIENVAISGVTTHGIDINRAAGTPDIQVMVKNSDIRNCGQNAVGITNAGAGQVVTSISNSKLQRCGNGISTGTHARVTVSNSEITHNTSNGISNTAVDSIVNADACIISFHPSNGIVSSGGADRIVRISRCSITQNGVGLSASGGAAIQSAGNNFNFGNATDGAPTATPGQS